MTKVVLDTNILVSAFIKYGGNESKIIEKTINRQITHITSEDILDEFHTVISRPQFRYSSTKIKEIMLFLIKSTQITTPTEKIGAIKEDPADNKILECATAAKADYIITGDKHLLNLKKYDGIPILTSTEFLKITDK
jgi:putative PIN family toxin of toxin-antitoxin system